GPVSEIAGSPICRMVMASSDIEMRSPAESSMSSSRRAGWGARLVARSSSSLVVLPMADTTTTTSSPDRRAATTFRATSRIRSSDAPELPPYFWTMMLIVGSPFELFVLVGKAGARREVPRDGSGRRFAVLTGGAVLSEQWGQSDACQ